jgi:hypothetical protein
MRLKFFNKFNIFASQPSEKDLEKMIKTKVKEVHKVEQEYIDSLFSDVEYRAKIGGKVEIIAFVIKALRISYTETGFPFPTIADTDFPKYF